MIRNTSGPYSQLSTDGFRLKNKHNKVILDASEADSIAELIPDGEIPGSKIEPGSITADQLTTDPEEQEEIRNLLKVTERVSVLQFGADPTGLTSSVTAINDAMSYAADNNIRIVYFPDGSYLIDEQILVPSGILLLGEYNFSQKTPNQGSRLLITHGANPANDTEAIENSTIILQIWAGIQGFFIYYPNQVDPQVATTPIPYSWTITTNKIAISAATGVPVGSIANVDGVVIKDLMGLNPYRFIDTTNSAQFNIQDIHGDPIYVGFVADAHRDVALVSGIHFWTYWCRTNYALWPWYKANSTGIVIGGVDGTNFHACFVWGRWQGMVIHTAAWTSLSDIDIDACTHPMIIDGCDMVTGTNIKLITTTPHSFCLNIRGSIFRSVNLANVVFYGTSVASAARIDSTGGSVNFVGCSIPRGDALSNLRRGIFVQPTCTSRVCVSTNAYDPPTDLYSGTEYLSVNGRSFPKFGDPVINSATPYENFQFKHWTAGEPDGWTLTNFSGPVHTLEEVDGGGVSINIANNGSLVTSTMDFPLNSYKTGKQYQIFKVKIAQEGTLMSAVRLFFRRCTTSGSNLDWLYSMSGIGFFDEPTTLVIPFVLGSFKEAGTSAFRIEVQSFNANTLGSLTLSDIEYVYADNASDPTLLEWLNNTTTSGRQPRLIGGKYIDTRDAVPTIGPWVAGDEIRYDSPADGGAIGAVCVTSGTPGTWAEYGRISNAGMSIADVPTDMSADPAANAAAINAILARMRAGQGGKILT